MGRSWVFGVSGPTEPKLNSAVPVQISVPVVPLTHALSIYLNYVSPKKKKKPKKKTGMQSHHSASVITKAHIPRLFANHNHNRD
ncbi:hypothetical protein BO71DRAFT_71210 [Aspergillus ellipticus CBS 707.79]|uniref:Uncharacterized protein n=1 Tax=Aspergillus ellipticus CBS 707.79 TaxID=1448320 RepID=A0A319DKZ8_9EURO|nr:hypothetical protein BO71DRAFT_71210 [Aspergillus ellipticus CBS 707.79]